MDLGKPLFSRGIGTFILPYLVINSLQTSNWSFCQSQANVDENARANMDPIDACPRPILKL
jgi:hypothetical protein